MQNERKVLVSALLKAEKSGYSNLILDHILSNNELSSNGRGFVTSAFYGVLERKYTLDAILNRFLKRPIKKAPPYTAAVLRSGVYQLLFMDKIPPSAAVNEAVILIKKSKERGNAGLVNAVLRKIADVEERSSLLPKKDWSIRFSVEPWLADALVQDYDTEAVEAFLQDSLCPPPVYIRIHSGKENAFRQVEKELTAQGGRLEATDLEDCYRVFGLSGLEQLTAYQQGLFFVQDYSSQFCVTALGAKPNERVLDCCAAPGGKTFSLALAMKNQGELIACDLHHHRVDLIAEGAARLGLSIVKSIQKDATSFDPALGCFDRVLCDVPCSGVGVIRRKPEIKYKSDAECACLISIQKNILETAAAYVTLGGVLVYSTCTLLKRENDAVVSAFLKSHPEFRPVAISDKEQAYSKTFVPPMDKGDGFYLAKMERIG